jgi:hypothetical protein
LGFLDCEVDLQGTPFNSEDLEHFRGYWRFLIENVAPEWLDEPKGHLALHWQSDTIPSVVYLIDLARMFYSLVHAITDASQTIFGNKLHQFLFSDGIQHEEQLTELLVGDLLTGLGGKPVMMEPVSKEAPPQGCTPGTVDYGIDWEDGQSIFVESTVFHIQRLLDWESAIATLKRRFEEAMVRQSLNRALRITAPLELTHQTLSAHALEKALSSVRGKARGRQSVKLVRYHLELEWEPAPHLEIFDIGREIPLSGFAFTTGTGAEFAMLAATEVLLKWPGDTEELVNKSLRNTLTRKRRQFELKLPYLLFLRITNDNISLKGVNDLLARRIYNNVHYRWLSAVGLLKSSFGQTTGHSQQVTLLSNPDAIYPLPNSFLAVLTGTDQKS